MPAGMRIVQLNHSAPHAHSCVRELHVGLRALASRQGRPPRLSLSIVMVGFMVRHPSSLISRLLFYRIVDPCAVLAVPTGGIGVEAQAKILLSQPCNTAGLVSPAPFVILQIYGIQICR